MERTANSGVTHCHHNKIDFDVVVGPEFDKKYPSQEITKKYLDLINVELEKPEYHQFLYHGQTFESLDFNYIENKDKIKIAVLQVVLGQFVIVMGLEDEVNLTLAEYAERILSVCRNPRQKAEERKRKRKALKRSKRNV